MRTQARFPEVAEKAGHYESFYLKLAPPEGGRAAWIRHTIHKRPGAEPVGSLWFTWFDASAAGPRATKQNFGSAQLGAGEGRYIRIGDASLGDGVAKGAARSEALDASWDLRFDGGAEVFRHLPRDFLYRAPVPRTKLLSPYPNSRYDGTITVGDETVEIAGWRGMVGHNWGAEHAERWVWIQGTAFDGQPEGDYFDMGAGRVKLAGMTTPWIGNGQLVLDGEAHRLGGIERVRSTEVAERPGRCEFEVRGKGIEVRGEVVSDSAHTVAWIYADPVGPEHNTLNSSISDLALEVRLADGPSRRLEVRRAAAYELGMRETDHGIPLQPYGDG